MKSSVAVRLIVNLSAFVCFGMSLSCGSGSGADGGKQLARIRISPANQTIPKGTTVQLAASGIYEGAAQASGSSPIRYPEPLVAKNEEIRSEEIRSPEIRPASPPPAATGDQAVETVALDSLVTWQTSQPSVATIDSQGVVTAVGQGVTQISATYEGVTGTTPLTVGQAALLTITVGPKQSSVAVGESDQLVATGNFSDGNTQDLTHSATWSSSVPATANVNAQGAVTGTSVGVAQVSAAYMGVTGSASVTVGPPVLLSITVRTPKQSSSSSSSSISVLPLGESEQLTATGNFSDGSTQDLTQSATWSSSEPATVKVSAQGVVTGLGVGAVQVSATYQAVSGSVSITVAHPTLVAITVSPNPSSLPLGESEQLTVTGNFSDGNVRMLAQFVTWTSSSANASVTNQGIVTAMSLGVAQVSASYQGLTGSAMITVGPPALLSITVNPNQYSLPVGETRQLTAIGNFSNGTTQNMTQSATWSSSSAIASVSATGMVTATAAGESTITASAGSVPGQVTGSANVTVTAAVAVALNIVPAAISLVIENSRQLHAMATMSDGTTQDQTLNVAWSAAQPSIASVTNYGMVTATQVGSTTIQAEINGVTGSASLTVIPLVALSYFNLANAKATGFDDTVQLVNPGVTSGNLCAMVYVMSNQVMNACCGCSISDSGIRTLSLANDLTANTLTGKKPVAGVIEVVASNPGSNGQCNAASPSPNGVILAWGTNVLPSTTNVQVTEESFTQENLSSTEAAVLSGECSMIQQLGSGAGICSCGTGGN
jgi:uncharacterized protein YjdB